LFIDDYICAAAAAAADAAADRFIAKYTAPLAFGNYFQFFHQYLPLI
jgi:hypothetical protein